MKITMNGVLDIRNVVEFRTHGFNMLSFACLAIERLEFIRDALHSVS